MVSSLFPASVSHVGSNAFRDVFEKQHEPICHVADGFSRKICEEGNGELISAILYSKIVTLFHDCLLEAGYEEPKYHRVDRRRDEEAPSTFIAEFYDEQGRIRKKYVHGYHRVLESMDAYGDGRWQGGTVVTVAHSEPFINICMYLPGKGRIALSQGYSLSLVNFEIRKKE